MSCSGGVFLGVPAVRQILARFGKSQSDEEQIIAKLEKSCVKFDHAGKGTLSVDDYYNVIKMQNGIDVSKEEVRNILAPLPKEKDGKVKIEDFLNKDVHSPEAFKAMDRNKDGYITKGELKLAKKNVGMKEIDKCIKDHDIDKDGKLNMDEFDKTVKKK